MPARTPGLATIVVVADPLGSQLAQTICVDSVAGNAFTYLSVDVPTWIRSTLQVDPDPRRWAVGGRSAGGTCALQLAVNAPTVYPTFLDISGQDEPTVGTRRQTVIQFFGGDPQPSLPSIPSMYSGAYDSRIPREPSSRAARIGCTARRRSEYLPRPPLLDLCSRERAVSVHSWGLSSPSFTACS
jgi:hypothetical protein